MNETVLVLLIFQVVIQFGILMILAAMSDRMSKK